jgi:hypothetical protein
MKRKLCVAGCSFSDRTKVDKSYGDYLADKLDFEYIHEGAGCGSNQRIWRKVGGHILSGLLTGDDIVVIQYTNIERKEFFSINTPIARNHRPGDINVVESYQDGSLIRYKYQASVWQDYANDKEFFKMYESDHINIKYEQELFNVNHHMFQSLCKEHNINVIFIDGHYAKPARLDTMIDDRYEPLVFDEDPEFMYVTENRLSPDDMGHMSVLGHMKYSELLYNHIRSLNLI